MNFISAGSWIKLTGPPSHSVAICLIGSPLKITSLQSGCGWSNKSHTKRLVFTGSCTKRLNHMRIIMPGVTHCLEDISSLVGVTEPHLECQHSSTSHWCIAGEQTSFSLEIRCFWNYQVQKRLSSNFSFICLILSFLTAFKIFLSFSGCFQQKDWLTENMRENCDLMPRPLSPISVSKNSSWIIFFQIYINHQTCFTSPGHSP